MVTFLNKTSQLKRCHGYNEQILVEFVITEFDCNLSKKNSVNVNLGLPSILTLTQVMKKLDFLSFFTSKFVFFGHILFCLQFVKQILVR
jgi:hypothetical protein